MMQRTYILCKRLDCFHNNGTTCSKYSVFVTEELGCSSYTRHGVYKDLCTIESNRYHDNIVINKYIREINDMVLRDLINNVK